MTTMRTRFTSTTLLAAVTVLALGAAPAFAANTSGYEFPDFWGTARAQQAPASAQARADGAPIHAYVTQSSHGTWLFPPNPNGGGANS
jgi:hypothetical protein